MLRETDIKRFYFELSETKPIEIIHNVHHSTSDHWFDMHYEFELGILLSGKMKREYFNHNMELSPGDTWICNMWEPHGFELMETPCEVVVFVIEPALINSGLPFKRNLLAPFQVEPAVRPVIKNRSESIQLARRALELTKIKENTDWQILLFLELIMLLTEDWEAPKNFITESVLKESIEPALRMVFEERRLITTEEAAAQCHTSVSGFRIAFKKLMKTSFADFALQYRVRGALSQLKNTHETQEAIAQNWGFTDASHLHKYMLRDQLTNQ